LAILLKSNTVWLSVPLMLRVRVWPKLLVLMKLPGLFGSCTMLPPPLLPPLVWLRVSPADNWGNSSARA
jgi:hypothetical protein